MSTSAARNPWIISPRWDLLYLVATPLLIVPAVLLLLRMRLTPEQVSLAVISFASLGHHLPGFMRAYGDRELFERFRIRFLLAPPLAFALALIFTPPSWLAAALNLPWTHLHGLELILLLWGTWHGLMQTYGFMRIYDLRRGENQPREAQLDHALCIAMFVCGVVFSDARVFGVAGAMWQSGLPLFGPEWLTGVRWAVGIASLLVAVAYVLNLLARIARGQSINALKVLLAGITGWFFWYTGRLSTNLLIGLAMFEIYHAVQYYAIVWIYNRRLFERAGERFGPLGFMFRDRYTMLGVYLAMIGAYSSIRYLTGDGSDYIFTTGGNIDAYQWLFALFVASSLLHFYYDGFIWKVSERKTRDNLVEGEDAEAIRERRVSGAVHLGKWAVLLAIVVGLLLAERRRLAADTVAHEAQQRRALAELTPELPEVQLLRSRDAMADGNTALAADLARRAAANRPQAAQVQADAGAVLLSAGEFAEARTLLQKAVERSPRDWQARIDLALASQALDDPEAAERFFREAIGIQPHLTAPRKHFAEFLRRQERNSEAAAELANLAEVESDNVQIALAHGDALRAAGKPAEAFAEFRRAASLAPSAAQPHYQLGLTRLLAGDAPAAIPHFRAAASHDADFFEAHVHLGDAFYALNKWPPAAAAYRRAAEINPQSDDACVNLASAVLNLGRVAEAEATLRAGLERVPDSAKICYTLGVLLERLGKTHESAELLGRAERLGIAGGARE
ncbi:tetratricopeptide repeat protein [Pirellulales bacterium]|nr:tetratricopeptide repeat protein [Pirellulales bacterium]